MSSEDGTPEPAPATGKTTGKTAGKATVGKATATGTSAAPPANAARVEAAVRLAIGRRQLCVWVGAAALGVHALVSLLGAAQLQGFWTTNSMLTLFVCVVAGIAVAVVRQTRLRDVERVARVRPSPRRNAAAGVYLLALPTILFLGMAVESVSIGARATETVQATVSDCADGCSAEWTAGGETHSGRVPFEAKPGATRELEVLRDRPAVVADQGNAWFVRGMPVLLLLCWLFLVRLWLRQSHRLNANLEGLVHRAE